MRICQGLRSRLCPVSCSHPPFNIRSLALQMHDLLSLESALLCVELMEMHGSRIFLCTR